MVCPAERERAGGMEANVNTIRRYGARSAIMHGISSRWLIAALTALLFAVAMMQANMAAARSAPESFADLVEKLLPGVVTIQVTQTQTAMEQAPQMPQLPPGSPFEDFFKDFFDRQQRGQQHRRPVIAVGSGFVIDAEGLIVTNNHVIDGADEIVVKFQDGTRLDAELVGTDPKLDVALLRVKPKGKLTVMKWGDSDTARIGDWVVAIGNPLGLGGTVTAGIVSARGRNINAGPYDDFIQTDASINKGNSGGPLFNVKGEVIGINTAILSQTGGSIGIGFAIPSNLAKNVVRQLKEFGHTKRGWLGVQIQQVTDELAEGLGLDKPRGALVAVVVKDGPASKSDIKAGDVILSFDGKPVKEMRELPRMVAETKVGKKVPVVLWRQGRKVETTVVLGELEQAEKNGILKPSKGKGAAPETGEVLGLALSSITPKVIERFNLPEDARGVIVVGVDEDSPAAAKGVRPGDVILEVGHEPVATPADVKRRIQTLRREKRKVAILRLMRGNDARFVGVPLEKKKK